MSRFDDSAIRAQLAELRTALAALEVPAPDEASLRARFRAAARRDSDAATAVPPRPRAARHLAAAGVLLLVGAALSLVPRPASERPPEVPGVPAVSQSSPAAEPFQRLPGSPGISPTASFSVVRVQIPLTSLAIVPGSAQAGAIEADLLVGEDGLAHGIRFMEGGAALGAARVQ